MSKFVLVLGDRYMTEAGWGASKTHAKRFDHVDDAKRFFHVKSGYPFALAPQVKIEEVAK
jgi:hypothetical protein